MTAKDYLSQVQEFDEKLDDERLYIRKLRESLVSVTGNLSDDKVQGSVAGDTMSTVIATILDAEERLKEWEEQVCAFRIQVITQIHQMKDVQLKELLMLKYIDWRNYRTLRDVAEIMGYSYDYTKELHSKALCEFGTTFPLNPT